MLFAYSTPQIAKSNFFKKIKKNIIVYLVVSKESELCFSTTNMTNISFLTD